MVLQPAGVHWKTLEQTDCAFFHKLTAVERVVSDQSGEISLERRCDLCRPLLPIDSAEVDTGRHRDVVQILNSAVTTVAVLKTE